MFSLTFGMSEESSQDIKSIKIRMWKGKWVGKEGVADRELLRLQ